MAVSFALDGVEQTKDFRSQLTKLVAMDDREFLEFPHSFWRELEHHRAAVGERRLPADQTAQFETIRQFDRRVVTDPQPFRQPADVGDVRRTRPQHQQRLMLLWRQPLPGGGDFAELEKAAQGITKVRQTHVIVVGKGFGNVRHSGLIYVVPRYKSSAFHP